MRRWLTVLNPLILGLGITNSSFALEFTADQITKIDGRTHKAVIYYRDQMWRIEHHELGPVNVTIVRKDKQVVWLLLSRMKHFKTMPYDAEQDLRVTPALQGEVQRQEIGTEVREGHPTILYEVTTKQGEHVGRKSPDGGNQDRRRVGAARGAARAFPSDGGVAAV